MPGGERRVVVTGLGCVSPLGGDVETTWQAALAGRSGVGPITRFDAAEYAVRIAAEAPEDLDLGDLSAKEARRLDRTIALAIAAAREAVADSGIDLEAADRDRIGTFIGSGIGGLGFLQNSIEALVTKGPGRVSPFTIPMAIGNMAAGYVAIQHGLRGPNLCHASACASGSHALADAARTIARGDADVMLAGGSEGAVTGIGVAGFAAMRALSTRNDAPEAASRPFDRDRDGFVVGEGAAVLVLEAEEHARARGARARARWLGAGATADAANVASPAEDGDGPRRCIELALRDADIAPGDVDHLNAHATGTPAGDPAEATAVRAAFGGHVDALPVSATKSMTGHLLGAAGALEALFCVRALETQVLPPTINLDHVDPACALDHVAGKAREARCEVALSTSFGFGGTNAAVLLAR